jgi:hypothetical protein
LDVTWQGVCLMLFALVWCWHDVSFTGAGVAARTTCPRHGRPTLGGCPSLLARFLLWRCRQAGRQADRQTVAFQARAHSHICTETNICTHVLPLSPSSTLLISSNVTHLMSTPQVPAGARHPYTLRKVVERNVFLTLEELFHGGSKVSCRWMRRNRGRSGLKGEGIGGRSWVETRLRMCIWWCVVALC